MNTACWAVVRYYTTTTMSRMLVWPCAIPFLAYLIVGTVVQRHDAPPPELVAITFLLCGTMVALIGVLCRAMIDEARYLLLPGAPRPQLQITGVLLLLVAIIPMVGCGIVVGLDPVTLPLGVAAMVCIALLLSNGFTQGVRHANQSPLRGLLWAVPLVPFAIPPLRNLLVEPFYLHPAWSVAQHLLCVASLLLVDLLLSVILLRTLRRILRDEPTPPVAMLVATDPLTHARISLPPPAPPGRELEVLWTLRHAVATMPAIPHRLSLGVVMAAFTAAYASCQRYAPDWPAHVLGTCTIAVLAVQILTQSDVMAASDGIRNDLLRPWSRRRWVWQLHGMLLWRNAQVWGAAWCGTLVGLCTYQCPRLSWLMAISLTLLCQPLLIAGQSVVLSLSRSRVAWIFAPLYSAQLGVVAVLITCQDDSRLFTPPLVACALLALLLVDGLMIVLLPRRWMRIDLA